MARKRSGVSISRAMIKFQTRSLSRSTSSSSAVAAACSDSQCTWNRTEVACRHGSFPGEHMICDTVLVRTRPITYTDDSDRLLAFSLSLRHARQGREGHMKPAVCDLTQGKGTAWTAPAASA